MPQNARIRKYFLRVPSFGGWKIQLLKIEIIAVIEVEHFIGKGFNLAQRDWRTSSGRSALMDYGSLLEKDDFFPTYLTREPQEELRLN